MDTEHPPLDLRPEAGPTDDQVTDAPDEEVRETPAEREARLIAEVEAENAAEPQKPKGTFPRGSVPHPDIPLLRSPVTIKWVDGAGHVKSLTVEGNYIHIPSCSKKKCIAPNGRGRPFQSGTIQDESDPEAFVAFDEMGAEAVKRSVLWANFAALVDLIQGKDGIGNLTRRWCVQCSGTSHDGPCPCACHRAVRYFVAVTEPGEEQVRDGA